MTVETCEMQHICCPQCGDTLHLRVWASGSKGLRKVFVCPSCPYIRR